MAPPNLVDGDLGGTVARPFSVQTAACRAAQEVWAETPVRQRLQPVRAFRHLLARDKARICQTIQADVGKPPRDALVGDVLALAEVCRFLERRALAILRPRRVPLRDRPLILWGHHHRVCRRPRGVVGVIGTWNLPFLINGTQIVQALVAGNGIVFKPSEVAPRSAALLVELLRQSGFPEGLVQLLPAVREAGPQLAAADIDHVAFTGHSATGRALATTLAPRLVPSTLELSGCDPLILLDDGDVALAARGAWFGATVNDGQACIGIRRAFVPRPHLPVFLDVLTPLVQRAVPTRAVLPAQIDLAHQMIDDACARGAVLIQAKGREVPAGHVLPAALVDIPADALLCREVVFAPLLGVLPFDRVEDVLALNAACPYALGTSIFTQDRAAAERLASRLRSGTVCINDVILPMGHPGAPFGGRGASGWGVIKGSEGLLEMTVPQVISQVRGRSRPHFDWHGGHWSLQQDTLEDLIDLQHAGSVGQALAAGWRLLRRLLGPVNPGQSAGQ